MEPVGHESPLPFRAHPDGAANRRQCSSSDPSPVSRSVGTQHRRTRGIRRADIFGLRRWVVVVKVHGPKFLCGRGDLARLTRGHVFFTDIRHEMQAKSSDRVWRTLAELLGIIARSSPQPLNRGESSPTMPTFAPAPHESARRGPRFDGPVPFTPAPAALDSNAGLAAIGFRRGRRCGDWLWGLPWH